MKYLAIILLALQALGATVPRISFNAATTNDVPPYMGTNANLVALQAYTPTTWQATNANLTLLSAFGPNTWQATNANLTLLQAHGPTTWQATNAALTALAGNPSLYQATNGNLTLLSAYGPTTWQATNAALTALAGNDGSYLTNSVPGGATNDYQFVTLKQLEESTSGGEVAYFNTASAAAGFAPGGTVLATNWCATSLPAQNTNTAVTAANGQYIAKFISTNTFTSFASGLAVVEVFAFENSPGAGDITAEAYIVNSVTKAEEHEFTPSPVYQTVPATATPTKLTFSIPITDYTSTTNLHFAIKFKVQESGTDPTIRIVTGGVYPSHVAFSVPLNSYVKRSELGIAATVDTLVSGGTTNRLVFVSGILVSNIPNFYP